jgi:myo-inositol-1(or 4)-monophosphatase
MMPTLSELETLARQAGAILCAGYNGRPGLGRRLQIDYKSLLDPVTEVDRRSEAFLLSEIHRLYPEDRVIAEESGSAPGRDCCSWYIDPLDGTVNFSHGIPIFSVSIGYAYEDVMQLGVVYDPMRDECFTAQRGRGAWLNGEPIQVSKERDLDRSLLVTGFPYDIRTNPENNLDEHARFSLRAQAVRRLGSAALDLCYVAAGRFDGYWEFWLYPWDVAAGGLIAEEAGARVTDPSGKPDYFSPPHSLVAANPALHTQLLAVLSGG